MTDPYTPEKVAELVADNRKWVQLHRENKYQREAAKRMTCVLDALTAVSAERDRLRKAITEALAEEERRTDQGTRMWRILRAALDKEGNDDD